LIAEKSERTNALDRQGSRRGFWLRLLLGAALGLGGLWLVGRNVSLAELGQALRLAQSGYILLGLALTVMGMAVKTWRWQLLYRPYPPAPSLLALWRALLVGQLVNLLAPFRLGEVARVYALYQQSRSRKSQALGTLVVEKALDLIMLALTLFILIPVVVVPPFLLERGPLLALLAGAGLAILYLLAYQTERVVAWLQWLAHWLPTAVANRLLQLVVSGLEGLAALRSRRLALALVGSSAVITLLSVLTPLTVFWAFDLPYGIAAATLLNLVLSLGMVPASTPAKVGVFEWLTAVTLKQLGLEGEALILSFALVYHLVVVLPQIILGAGAASRVQWR
jgi:glycosyltransferase 2 family protein